jgi:hypothetical protein
LAASGSDAAGNYFELDMVDVSATIGNGENYTCATFTGAANAGSFYYDGPAPAFTPIYEADPTITPNSLIIHVTTHNVPTKRVTGTFAGNAKDAGGNPAAVTLGTFTFTYP